MVAARSRTPTSLAVTPWILLARRPRRHRGGHDRHASLPRRLRSGGARWPAGSGGREDRRLESQGAARLLDPRDVRGRHRPDRRRGQVAPRRTSVPRGGLRPRPRRRGVAGRACTSLRTNRATRKSHLPVRPRKLLLHRQRDLEARRCTAAQEPPRAGLLRVYFTHGLAKVELALARGQTRLMRSVRRSRSESTSARCGEPGSGVAARCRRPVRRMSPTPPDPDELPMPSSPSPRREAAASTSRGSRIAPCRRPRAEEAAASVRRTRCPEQGVGAVAALAGADRRAGRGRCTRPGRGSSTSSTAARRRRRSAPTGSPSTLGPEPGRVGRHAAGGASGTGRARLAEGALRSAAVVGRDPHHRRDDGELHRAGRARARWCGRCGRASTSTWTGLAGAAADARLRRRLRAPERHEGARDARARAAMPCGSSRATASGGSTSRPRARARRPRRRARRS